MTELKIQDQLSEMGLSRISIEPLGIDKWSAANDNPLTTFLRSSLDLPDPHDTLIKEDGFYKNLVAAQFDKTGVLK